MPSPEEEAARATILSKLEGEKLQQRDEHRFLLLEVVNQVIRASPTSLPTGVREARRNMIQKLYGKGEKETA